MLRPSWEHVTWWVVLFGLYLGLVTTRSLTEAIVGAVAALAASVVAVAARRADRAAYRPSPGWLGWLGGVPGRVLRDSIQLVRRRSGEFGEVRLPVADAARAAARRALATIVISVSPGTYVADVRHGNPDGDPDVLVVHRAGPEPSPLERKVSG